MSDGGSSVPVRGNLMQGKRGLVMGVANDRSIGWAIAQACAQQGAELAFTYQGEALEKRVRPLAESVNSSVVISCDVASDDDIERAFGELEHSVGKIDFLVHAIGWADKQYLRGRYIDTPREAFLEALNISCYSFVGVAKRAASMMNPGGSILTLTYLGSERVMPHYNVMGVAKAALEASVRYMAVDLGGENIRVNALSAGPVKTLAASGIGDFRYILKWNQLNSPLGRNVSLDDVGGAGLYLLSSLSGGVTGEVHHVDNGYHLVGMKNPAAPDIALVLNED
ncbi:enoyl-ACP reductase FabI [Entomobacter blattae]|uniref:Enoyl-[acyl-carrier-protein] reductase [NADH] n=1 Tax=Entomobacter blattae TaxID=2762277 RepID=A0A7H1NQI7_9PROT|nr:SDR family oxidoreductase [Entomobacter blattae]QNT78047.1 Enoyl-[acyl-carrier-protein] reductase [NADH] FabI [Entomobacter blattae]